jgi:hypothetical protein
MMLGVFVLARARQEGPCCDVLFSRFWELVPVRVLGFPTVFRFCGFCFLSFFFLFLFWYPFCILSVCLGRLYTIYKISLLTYKKKMLSAFMKCYANLGKSNLTFMNFY